jgi:hypothetical protein
MTITDEELARLRRDLAGTIAARAQAISDGAVVGSEYAAVRLLLANAETLAAWTPVPELRDAG